MKKSHFSVLAGIVLSCAALLNACKLEPSVSDPISETAVEQPAGMPPGIGFVAKTPRREGEHFVLPVSVIGTLDPDESPKFTAKSTTFDPESATYPTGFKAQTVEALLVGHVALFGDGVDGVFPLDESVYGEDKTIFTIVQLDVGTIKEYLQKKHPAGIWWVQENPEAFGTAGKPYPGITGGWKKVGSSSTVTPGANNVVVTGLTVDNIDTKIDSFSVVVVAGSTVKISFFGVEPYPDGDLTGSSVSDFVIATIAGGDAPLEPIFVYEIDGTDLTAVSAP
jgi:hypothetical protein